MKKLTHTTLMPTEDGKAFVDDKATHWWHKLTDVEANAITQAYNQHMA